MVRVERRENQYRARRSEETRTEERVRREAIETTQKKKADAVTETKPQKKPTTESSNAARAMLLNDPRTQQLRGKLDQQLVQRPYQVPDESKFNVPTSERERNTDAKEQQLHAVKESLRTGQPVPFVNSEGKTSDLKVEKTDKGYVYTLDNRKTEVEFDASYSEEDREKQLARLVDYHSQQPSVAKDGVVDKFVFTAKNEAEEHTAFYRREDKSIHFNGPDALSEYVFNHEMGHGVGYKLAGRDTPVPAGWDDAAKADGNELSGYGKQSAGKKEASWEPWIREKLGDRDWAGYRSDDFAEAYAAYAEAKESGPEAVEKFRQKYPNRAKVLEPYFRDELRDAPLPSDPTLPVAA